MTALSAVAFDCRDVRRLAEFWSQLLDRPVAQGAHEWFASIGEVHRSPRGADGPTLLFMRVDERAPGKNPVHLDLYDDDREAAVEHAVGLGAVRVADFDEYGVEWTTLQDPEGNLFDIGRPSRSTPA